MRIVLPTRIPVSHPKPAGHHESNSPQDSKITRSQPPEGAEAEGDTGKGKSKHAESGVVALALQGRWQAGAGFRLTVDTKSGHKHVLTSVQDLSGESSLRAGSGCYSDM